MTIKTKKYGDITLRPVMVDVDGRNLEEAVEVSSDIFSFDVLGYSMEEVEEIFKEVI